MQNVCVGGGFQCSAAHGDISGCERLPLSAREYKANDMATSEESRDSHCSSDHLTVLAVDTDTFRYMLMLRPTERAQARATNHIHESTEHDRGIPSFGCDVRASLRRSRDEGRLSCSAYWHTMQVGKVICRVHL